MRLKFSTLIICILLVSYLANAQQYDSIIVADGKKPDENNLIFLQGNVFTYQVETESDLDLPDQIIYTVLGLPTKKRTNRKQTEVVISTVPDKRKYENTGIVDNPSNLWMHPPRSGTLKVLETCPFPYVKFPLEQGSSWSDQILIGEQWSLGMWKGKMLFDVVYSVVGKKQLEMDNIRFECWVIEATAQSEVGATKTTITYHEDEGFVELLFNTLQGDEITFKLESIVQGPVYKNMNNYFTTKLNSSN